MRNALGLDKVPTLTDGDGSWMLDEVHAARQDGIWPFVPPPESRFMKYKVVEDGATAYWSLDGHTQEDINGYDLSHPSGMEFGDSLLALEPGGKSLVASTGSRPPFDTRIANLTLECWIEFSGTATSAGIYYIGDGGLRGYGLRMGDGSGGSGTGMTVLLGGTSWNALTSNPQVPVGVPVHVVLTRDSSTWRLYFDGVQVATGTANPNAISTSDTLSISGSSSIKIDAVAFYPFALTPTQIQEHYDYGSTPFTPPLRWEPRFYSHEVIEDGAVAYWTLDDSDTTARDKIAALNGTYEATYSHVSGPLDDFSNPNMGLDVSSQGYVQVPDDPTLDFTAAISMEFWVYNLGNSGPPQYIVLNKESSYEIGIGVLAANQLAVALWTTASWAWVDSGYVVPTNVWKHIVVTYDGPTGRIRFYSDGELVGETAHPNGGNLTPTNQTFRIGDREGATADWFNGYLDEVALYAVALNGEQVKRHYLRAKSIAASNAYYDAVMADAPLSYWRLGELSGTTAADEQARYPGTYTGPVRLGAPGGPTRMLDTSVRFDDRLLTTSGHTVAHVLLPTSFTTLMDGKSTVTWEAWVYLISHPSGTAHYTILSEEHPTNVQFTLTVDGSKNNRLFAGIYDGAWHQAIDNQPFPLRQWVHVAGSYDGSTIRTYRDGRLCGQAARAGSLPTGGGNYRIGKRWDYDHGWNGLIDEVSVFDRVVTQDDLKRHSAIGRHMNESTYLDLVGSDDPTGFWRLDEASGAFIDSSGNGYDSTEVVGVSYAQPDGIVQATSVEFAGAQHIRLPDTARVSDATEWTVEIWAKSASTTTTPVAYSEGIPAGWSADLFLFYIGEINQGGGGIRIWYDGTSRNIFSGDLRGTWNHCVLVVKSDGTGYLYVNGVLVSTSAGFARKFASTHVALGAGYQTGWTQHYTGKLDEVATYRRALTADEVLEHYHQGIAG